MTVHLVRQSHPLDQVSDSAARCASWLDAELDANPVGLVRASMKPWSADCWRIANLIKGMTPKRESGQIVTKAAKRGPKHDLILIVKNG